MFKSKILPGVTSVIVICVLVSIIMVGSRLVASSAVSATYNITVQLVNPTPTPSAAIMPYLRHFQELSIGQPGDWFINYNAQMSTNGTGAAKTTVDSADVWGQMNSSTNTLDFDEMTTMHIVLTGVDASTGYKVNLKETGQPTTLIETNVGIGARDVNIGWTGSKTFYIELIVESSIPGNGIQYDELWLYNPNRVRYKHHFNETLGQQPGDWFVDYNAQMTSNGSGSAKLATQAGDVWCRMNSGTMNFDVDTFSRLYIALIQIDGSTGFKIYVRETGQTEILISDSMQAGRKSFDLKTITGWSGIKDFHIELIVESGAAGFGTTIDEIIIGENGLFSDDY